MVTPPIHLTPRAYRNSFEFLQLLSIAVLTAGETMHFLDAAGYCAIALLTGIIQQFR